MDRLYPAFHFELPMLASSERRGQKGVELSEAGRGPQVGAPVKRRNNSKALIGQIEKALQGLGETGLKCPLAWNLPQAPILRPSVHRAPVKLPHVK